MFSIWYSSVECLTNMNAAQDGDADEGPGCLDFASIQRRRPKCRRLHRNRQDAPKCPAFVTCSSKEAAGNSIVTSRRL